MKIEKTDNYGIFKQLKGNRSVPEKRVGKIIKSIEAVGYIPSPIVVNERMEIVDGQGRHEACKRLGLPIFYIVVNGIGLEECISMNINSTNWSMTDYIRSYSDTGNSNYVRLEKLVDYAKPLGISIVMTAAFGTIDDKNDSVKAGTIKLTAADEAHAMVVLDYLQRFVPLVKQRKIPNANALYTALAILHDIDGIDNERMHQALFDYYPMLGGYANTQQAVEALERVYNYRLSTKNKVLVFNKYRETMMEKYGWYEAKYA